MAELGPGVRTPKNELNKRWAGFLRFRISEREKEMKANGEKPWGLKTRAQESIAVEEGMSITTMIRKLQLIEERRRGERSKN